ncbi:NTP transferase domain-containing protein [Methanopyrus sp. SNP6]|uniref:NTP transferase domain-containing protein n=1 Tax=Methanopyrus sp. SNP6 TaxID=1937005 RepID=UPI00143BC544|nr:NTP transferase domain-containing protein [Methanopyrus sp. SNP6]
MPKLPALVMAGGRAKRMGGVEKPAVEVAGKPLLVWVLEALQDCSCVKEIIVAVSRDARVTRSIAKRSGTEVVITPGRGYIHDLRFALENVGTPALTVTADLPCLAADIVDFVIAVWAAVPEPSLSVWVPQSLIVKAGLSLWRRFESIVGNVRAVVVGLNVVGDLRKTDEFKLLLDEPRLAYNVNTWHDLRKVEGVLRSCPREEQARGLQVLKTR